MLTTQSPDPSAKKPFLLWRPFVALWNWLVPPSVAHADRQPRVARFIAAGTVVLVAVALVLVVLMNARDWHRSWNRWSAGRMSTDAIQHEKDALAFHEQEIKSGSAQDHDAMLRSYKLAQDKATQAYVKDPDNPDAIRLLARIYTLQGRNEALYFWKKGEKLGVLTDEDLAWRIKALTRNNEDKEAGDQIDELLKRGAPSKKALESADEGLRRLGHTAKLLEILKDHVASHPEDSDSKLLLALRQLQFGSDAGKQEGLAMLWSLSADDGETGIKALGILNAITDLSTADQKRLIDRLQRHPLAKETERIAALKRLVIMEPARKDAIMAEAVKSHLGAKREDLVPLTRWLYEERQPEKIMELLKEDEVRTFPPLLGDYLNALTMLKRFDDIERVVKDRSVMLSDSQRDFHLVQLAFVKNTLIGEEEDKFDELLGNAIASARKDGQVAMMLDLGRYALVRKHYASAIKAYDIATRVAGFERAGFDGLLNASYLAGNMKDFASTAKKVVGRWPDNQSYAERYYYACLLGGMEIEVVSGRAQKLLESRPNDTQRKLLVALSCYRMADREGCRNNLQNASMNELSPGQRAVFCGLARMAGFANDALTLSRTIRDDEPMLPEEQRFLRIARSAAAAR